MILNPNKSNRHESESHAHKIENTIINMIYKQNKNRHKNWEVRRKIITVFEQNAKRKLKDI